jgi:uncharacterized membrane protein
MVVNLFSISCFSTAFLVLLVGVFLLSPAVALIVLGLGIGAVGVLGLDISREGADGET